MTVIPADEGGYHAAARMERELAAKDAEIARLREALGRYADMYGWEYEVAALLAPPAPQRPQDETGRRCACWLDSRGLLMPCAEHQQPQRTPTEEGR